MRSEEWREQIKTQQEPRSVHICIRGRKSMDREGSVFADYCCDGCPSVSRAWLGGCAPWAYAWRVAISDRTSSAFSNVDKRRLTVILPFWRRGLPPRVLLSSLSLSLLLPSSLSSNGDSWTTVEVVSETESAVAGRAAGWGGDGVFLSRCLSGICA